MLKSPKHLYKKSLETGSKLCTVYVWRAIQRGLLDDLKKVKKECFYCKINRASVYDHRDYNKPLEVKPICRSCNRKLLGVKYRIKQPKAFHKSQVEQIRKLYSKGQLNQTQIGKLYGVNRSVISKLVNKKNYK